MALLIWAMPVFFGLIFLEWCVARWQHKQVFRLADSLTDLSNGIFDRVVDIFVKTGVVAVYILLYERFGQFTISSTSAAAWIVCFVLVDFLFYWAHRSCHSINFLWACHIVHHQSEDFNLTVALRQSATEHAITWSFYLPLAIVGFPPEMWFVCYMLNLYYQFWIHTRTIGRLGPVEWIFNTPSHHRVHHGSDAKYIDKNHAGTLIIWDKLFGTFQREEEEPVYGIVTQFQSWNPIWAHLHYWVSIAKLSWRAPCWTDKVRVWFAEPGWHPRGVEPAYDARAQFRRDREKWDTPLPPGMGAYCVMQFVVMMALFGAFFMGEPNLTWAAKLVPAALVVAIMVVIGGLLEVHRWAFLTEKVRIATTAALLIAFGGTIFGWTQYPGLSGGPALAALAIAGVALAHAAASLVWLRRIEKRLSAEASPRSTGITDATAEIA